MKKFMLLVLLGFVLSQLTGCATSSYPRNDSRIENPHANNFLGYGAAFAAAEACRQKYGLLGAAVCGALTKEMVDAFLWKKPPPQPIENVQYVVEGGGVGVGNVYCDRSIRYGLNPPPQGMCNNPNGNGIISYQELVRQSQMQNGQYMQNAAYTTSSANMWEGVSVTKQAAAKAEAKVEVDNHGITVNNYYNSDLIHPACKTLNPETNEPVNHGADGVCLLSKVPTLVSEQKACDCIARGDVKKCEVNLRNVFCPKTYNPGYMAGIYYRIGNELRDLQRKEQGGDLVFETK